MLVTGATGVGGIAINAGGTFTTGHLLHAAAPLINGGAIFGTGSARTPRLVAGDVLTFWVYANGGTVTVNASANAATHWAAAWVAP